MKYLFLLLLSPFLLSAQIEHITVGERSPPPLHKQTVKDFPLYTTIGFTTYPRTLIKHPENSSFVTGIDMGIGTRRIMKQHGWDALLGVQGNHFFQSMYIQSSYLFYPLRSPGIYLGAGLNLGMLYYRSIYWKQASVPWILGYQLEKSFVQLRVIHLRQADFCYGFEF